jgi:hypothetical protein
MTTPCWCWRQVFARLVILTHTISQVLPLLWLGLSLLQDVKSLGPLCIAHQPTDRRVCACHTTMPSKEAARFQQIFKNIGLMLEARDYYPAHDWVTSTVEDFEAKVGTDVAAVEDYALLAMRIGDDTDRLCVFFPQERINKAVHTKFRERALGLGCTGVIYCARTDMTAGTRQLISADPNLRIEFFVDWMFLVNLVDHDFVPQHVVLTGECVVVGNVTSTRMRAGASACDAQF